MTDIETREWVSLAEIDDQRESNWADFHPEDFCHRCGRRNPSWFIDSDRFNIAMGRPDQHQWNGIVCPSCFVVLHQKATGMACTWKLEPSSPFHWIEES